MKKFMNALNDGDHYKAVKLMCPGTTTYRKTLASVTSADADLEFRGFDYMSDDRTGAEIAGTLDGARVEGSFVVDNSDGQGFCVDVLHITRPSSGWDSP
ncbi:MAG: hypothetical protein ACRDP3_12195 [Streptomyces sp.]|uniref:hypothetical protein n=1 Tax=Streptomyces sp. TaxID=1931 RepID=UPI003D6B5115